MLIHDSDGEEWADGLRYKMSENVAEPISETSGLLGKVSLKSSKKNFSEKIYRFYQIFYS